LDGFRIDPKGNQMKRKTVRSFFFFFCKQNAYKNSRNSFI